MIQKELSGSGECVCVCVCCGAKVFFIGGSKGSDSLILTYKFDET